MTGQREIFRCILSAVLTWDDVFNVNGQWFLIDPAAAGNTHNYFSRAAG